DLGADVRGITGTKGALKAGFQTEIHSHIDSASFRIGIGLIDTDAVKILAVDEVALKGNQLGGIVEIAGDKGLIAAQKFRIQGHRSVVDGAKPVALAAL